MQVTHSSDDLLLLAQRQRQMQIKFNANYATVAAPSEETFIAFVANYLVVNHPDGIYSQFQLSEGQIFRSIIDMPASNILGLHRIDLGI